MIWGKTVAIVVPFCSMPPVEQPPAHDQPSSTGIGRFESSSFKKRLSGGSSSAATVPTPTTQLPAVVDSSEPLQRAVVPPPRRYEHRYTARGIFMAVLVCVGGIIVAWVMITDVYRNVEVTPAMLLGVVTASIVFTQVFLTSRTASEEQAFEVRRAPLQETTATIQPQQPQMKLFGAPAVSSMPANRSGDDLRQTQAAIAYPDPRATQDNPLSPPGHHYARGAHDLTPHRIPSPYAVADTPSMASVSRASLSSTPLNRSEPAWGSGRPGASLSVGGVSAADVFGHEVVSAWARTVASDVIDRQIVEPLIRMLALSDSQLSNAVKVAGQGFFLACATVSDGGRTITRPPMSSANTSMGGEPSALPGAIYLSDRNLPHPLSSLSELNAAWKHRLVLERYFLLPPIQEADSISTPSGYGGGLLYSSRDYVVSRVCDWATHGLRSGYQYDQKEVLNTVYDGRASGHAPTAAVATTTCDTVTDSRVLDHVLLHALDCHMNAGGSAGARPFTSTFVRSVDVRDGVESQTALTQAAGLVRPPRWSTGGLGLGRRGADSPVWIQRCYDTSTGIITYNVMDATRVGTRGVGGAMQRDGGSSRAGELMVCQRGNTNIVQALAVFLWSLKKASPDHFSTLPNAFKNAVGNFPPPNPPQSYNSGGYPPLPQYFSRRSI